MDNKISVIVKGIITHKNRVLIVKRSNRAKLGPGNWEFVGGNIEFGEDLEEALNREAMEEIGMPIEIDKVLYATTSKISLRGQAVIIVYKCFGENEKVVLSEEHSDYKWVSKEDLGKFLYGEMLRDIDKYNILPLIFE